MQKLYICVSHDKYELPEAIADTAQELADICGATKAVVQSCISTSMEKLNGRDTERW